MRMATTTHYQRLEGCRQTRLFSAAPSGLFPNWKQGPFTVTQKTSCSIFTYTAMGMDYTTFNIDASAKFNDEQWKLDTKAYILYAYIKFRTR